MLQESDGDWYLVPFWIYSASSSSSAVAAAGLYKIPNRRGLCFSFTLSWLRARGLAVHGGFVWKRSRCACVIKRMETVRGGRYAL